MAIIYNISDYFHIILNITNVFFLLKKGDSRVTSNLCVNWTEMSRLLPESRSVNIRLAGQNWPDKDCNPAHWKSLENVKRR